MQRKLPLLSLFLLLSLSCVACGEDSSSDASVDAMMLDSGGDSDVAESDLGRSDELDEGMEMPGPLEPICSLEGLEGQFVHGRVFEDVTERANTRYQDGYQEGESPGLGGVDVELLGPDGASLETTTCEDGFFAFPALEAGRYLVDVKMSGPECRSSNDARRFPEAVREGRVTMVTFGDSLPHFGPTPWFPARFTTLMAPLAEVANVNVAVPGSRSDEWTPGTRYFDQVLTPELEEADLVVFSLGGNDLRMFAEGVGRLSQQELIAQLGDLPEVLDEIQANIVTIARRIRELAPDADIVWLLYLNYARSAEWQQILGPDYVVVERAFQNMLQQIRTNMAEEDMLLMDMPFATEDMDINPLLSDPVHLSVPGHQFFAEELFVTLGGTLFDRDPTRGVEHNFAYQPLE